MSLELLKAVLAYRPPKKLHPIGHLLLELYEAGNGSFDDDALNRIRAELERCSSDLKELTDANCALLGFVKLARDEWEHPEAGDAIWVLFTETHPKYLGLFEKIAETLAQLPQDISAHAQGLLERLTGEQDETRTKAPVHNEVAPVNSVPLKKLAQPHRALGPPQPRRPPVRPPARKAAGRR